MFDYTRAAINKVINDFKKIALGINIVTQLLTIAYLFYAVFAKTGVFIANVILLVGAIGYFIFFIYITRVEIKKEIKQRIKEIYDWCKRGIKLLSIAITIYGLIITSSNFSIVPLLLLFLTIVGWILEFIFYLVCKFLEAEKQLIIDGFKTDMYNYTKPFRTVGNFVKKLTGKKVEEEPAPNKNHLLLDKLVAKEKNEKENKRIEKRAKFSLWVQDKLDIFKRKKTPLNEAGEPLEQIPAPIEEQAFTEIETTWDDEI